MAPQDAVLGWDEEATAAAYAAFTRAFPMYAATSRDLARRARLGDCRLIVDLCGGAGATAEAILALGPAHARVISLDSAAAMQDAGRRTLTEPRLSWVTAPAERLTEHIPAGRADAVVCNSAIWKTDIAAVFAGVAAVLRPGGRFVFNIGGGFAGVTHPDEAALPARPSLNSLIQQIAARDYGYTPLPEPDAERPKLPLGRVRTHLEAAGMRLLNTEVTAQHSTLAEKKAWLSIPVFVRPAGGSLTHEERMAILTKACAHTSPDTPTVTSWLVVTADRPASRTDE